MNRDLAITNIEQPAWNISMPPIFMNHTETEVPEPHQMYVELIHINFE